MGHFEEILFPGSDMEVIIAMFLQEQNVGRNGQLNDAYRPVRDGIDYLPDHVFYPHVIPPGFGRVSIIRWISVFSKFARRPSKLPCKLPAEIGKALKSNGKGHLGYIEVCG